MKKIILSATVAAMALTTTASALEDIKVNGQAKIWYETNNAGTNSMFDKNAASGEAVFKLGVTGKQGNVGFGATVYQTSAMGLEKTLVSGVRNGNNALSGDGEMYTGEMYVTVPLGAKTLLKLGKQELDTPLAFTERWNAVPNTFDAAVAINNSINNLTLIAAYVGQGDTGEIRSGAYAGTSVYAFAALYKTDALGANVWFYDINSAAKAYWADVALKAGPANIKLYGAIVDPEMGDAGNALAISAGMKVGSVSLFAAASTVSDDGQSFGNTATADKKTKLPTMAVYTDGKYVAQSDSTAFKIKASTKIAGTGLALQYVNNSNDSMAALDDMSEIDLIASTKLGDVNLKGILIHRDGDASNAGISGYAGEGSHQHVRVIASVNF